MGEKRGPQALEAWCRRITAGYAGVNITNMSSSWRDGLAFCAIVHHFRPDLIDFDSLNPQDVYKNNETAFTIAEQHLGIPALLDPQDMVKYAVPDRLSILTYLSQFYNTLANQSKVGVSPRSAVKRTVPDHPPKTTPSGPSEKVFVRQIQTPSRPSDKCTVCHNPVFLAERFILDRKLFHRTCFRCARCNAQLSVANCYETEQGQFCCETCPDEEKQREVSVRAPEVGRLTKTAEIEQKRTSRLAEIKAKFEASSPRKSGAASFIRDSFTEVRETSAAVSAEDKTSPVENETNISKGTETKTPVPKTRTSVLEAKRTVPEEAPVPKTRTTVPESSATVPEQVEPVPGLRDVPEQVKPVSAVRVVSGQVESAPKSSAAVPEQVEPVPELRHVPEKAKSIAESSATVPGEAEPVPALRDVPEQVKSVPESSAVVPEQAESIREPVESVPESSAAVSEQAEPIPELQYVPEQAEPIPEQPAEVSEVSELEKSKPESLNPFGDDDDDDDEDAVVTNDSQREPNESFTSDDNNRGTNCVEISVNEDPVDNVVVEVDLPKAPNRKKRSSGEPISSKSDDKQPIGEEEYPDDLNPFADEEEEAESGSFSANVSVLSNVFDSSTEDSRHVICQKVLRAPRISLNPFGSDDDDDEEATPPAKPPRPPPPTATLSRNQSEASVSSPKKRPAPPPPIRSPEEKPTSPITTLHRKKDRPAPPPPPPATNPELRKLIPGSLVLPRLSEDDSASNNSGDDSILREKTEKNLSNLSRQNKDQYGQWKRKKAPAPPRPLPQKRQLRKLPLKMIQQELEEIEAKQQELETQGVILEQSIRDITESETGAAESQQESTVEDMILQLFDMVNVKNELLRRQTELMYLKRQQRLEEEHAELEFQIRCIMEKPEAEKTDEDHQREEKLIQRLVEVVHRRAEVIDCLEMDRRREVEEDRSIQQHLEEFTHKQESPKSKSRTLHVISPLKIGKKKKSKKPKDQSEAAEEVHQDPDRLSTNGDKEKDKKKSKWFGK